MAVEACMSLNAAKERRFAPGVDSAKRILELLKAGIGFSRRTLFDSRTEEEKNVAESEAIAIIGSLIVGGKELPSVQNSELEYTNEKELTNVISQLSNYGYQKILSLILLYLDYYNSYQIALMDLTGQIRRVKQKKAVLDMWDSSSKYILSEKFFNFDFIDSSFTSVPSLEIDTFQGIATLPIRERVRVSPSAISIGSNSNGVPGNSDIEVNSRTNDPRNILKENDIGFEYERLDSSPCQLSLLFQFSKEEIINSIEIKPITGQVAPFEVIDIYFARSEGRGYRLSQMLPNELPDDFLTISNSNDAWRVTFLPVPAKMVTVVFRQTAPSTISVATSKQTVSNRSRFSIGLSSINFYRNKYFSEGGINSKAQELPGDLYAVNSKSLIYPSNRTFYKFAIELSTDNGQSWKQLPLGEAALLNGDEESCIWKLLLKNTEPFNLDILLSDNKIYEINSISRTVSNKVSPVDFRLPEKPQNGEAFVLKKIAKRTDALSKAIRLSTGTAASAIFPIPFDIDEYNIEPGQLNVFVNNHKWTEVVDTSSLGFGYYMFVADHRALIFDSSLPDKSIVSISVSEERCLFEERQDGFYLSPQCLFDPDNYIFTHIPSSFNRNSRILPRGVNRIVLDQTEIDPNSFSIISSTGITYNSVTTRLLLAAPGDYCLDAVNGILYLFEGISTDVARCIFKYARRTELDKAFCKTIFDELKPSQIRVDKNSLSVHEVTDIAYGSLAGRINISTGEFETRTDVVPGANRAVTLSYDYIIKNSVTIGPEFMGYTDKPTEADFIDGYTEFLGLIAVDKENTIALTAEGTGISQFNLSAGATWYPEMDVSFSDTTVFTNKKLSFAALSIAGDYYISDEGLVSVVNNVPANIEMSYYYRDLDWDSSNRFSVDYRNGILYTSENIQNGSEIKYKATSYKLSYDICEVVKNTFNNSSQSVRIDSEGMNNINLIKILWRKASSDPLPELSNYFSPILYSVKLGFE